jgi:hypothetical protein
MPKVLFFSDPSNGRPGLGATIRLDSGEPCLMSISPGWVRVKKSRTGLFGPTLYNVRDVQKTYETAKALALLFPDSLLPPGFTDPVLSAFANAILHCATCSEVAIILNGAIEEADRKIVEADRKIVFAFADFCEKTTTRMDAFYDASVLPYPREAIISAMEREIVRSPFKGYVDSLRTSAMFMYNFLEGIGPEPIPLDASRAEAETKKVEERISAAVRVWNHVRLSGLSQTEKMELELADKMTATQIAEAQRLAREWKPKPN